jgi:hypothetical protein
MDKHRPSNCFCSKLVLCTLVLGYNPWHKYAGVKLHQSGDLKTNPQDHGQRIKPDIHTYRDVILRDALFWFWSVSLPVAKTSP